MGFNGQVEREAIRFQTRLRRPTCRKVRQWCAAKCCTTGIPMGEASFVVSASFCGAETPTIADISDHAGGKKGDTQPSQASVSWGGFASDLEDEVESG